jgi:hypothetical protein
MSKQAISLFVSIGLAIPFAKIKKAVQQGEPLFAAFST